MKTKQVINNIASKIGLKEVFEDQYSPYCRNCDSCGEVGCCSPVHCDMKEGCQYPETYLTEFRYNYTSYHRLLTYFYENEDKYPEVITMIELIQDEEYDKWHPERVVIYDKNIQA